jgi:hypothetical protein
MELIGNTQQVKVRSFVLYILLNTDYNKEITLLFEWFQMVLAERIHLAYEDVVKISPSTFQSEA